MDAAYLILAHRNFGQVARLVERLRATEAGVVVHVDRAVPMPTELAPGDDVHLVADRFASRWGSHELVLATLALMREARRRFPDARYHTLLSGQDYPIKPAGYIASFFDRAESDYLRFMPLPDSDLHRIDRYHWGKARRSPVGWVSRRIPLPPRRFGIPREALFRGSQWWSLRAETAAEVLRVVDSRPEVVDAFRRTYVPDEMFFQTVVVGLLCRPTVVNYNLRHVEFAPTPSRIGTGARSAPRLLHGSDLETLRGSQALFARKFDSSVDPDVLDLIDEMTGG